MNKLLNTILNLIENTVLEYELLVEETTCEFPIMVIRCNIRKADLTSENQYFIVIQDSNGSHCVDWFTHKCQVDERLALWKNLLDRGNRDMNEYSFPSIFPIRKYTLTNS